MAESVTVSARLPADCKRRLDDMLNGRSLGAWLQKVVDGVERVGNLEARARELERAITDREAKLEAFENKLRQCQTALEELQALRRVGVSPEQVSKWSAILSRAGTEPGELESDIERYGSLLAACREPEAREKKLEVSVRAVEGKRGELEGAVAALKGSALSAVAKLKDQSLAELEAAGKEMREKIDAYGEACPLSEVLRRDLPLAAALHGMGAPELAAEVPPATVLLVLDRVRRWSDATGANPRARPPEPITGGTGSTPGGSWACGSLSCGWRRRCCRYVKRARALRLDGAKDRRRVIGWCSAQIIRVPHQGAFLVPQGGHVLS